LNPLPADSFSKYKTNVIPKEAVLENVRQRQQHRCQEIFDKTYSQEIFLHLAGNSCHLIN
jgi:hypothetical protein